jgi:hypothetical protein
MNYSLLRKTERTEEILKKASQEEAEITDFSRIRCPKCLWQPKKSSRWYCADSDFPEYFYNACYTAFNTFETRGVCPVCRHQWRWTSCLQCAGWSLHEDWYEKGKD